jgi:hypothetical protein
MMGIRKYYESYNLLLLLLFVPCSIGQCRLKYSSSMAVLPY